MPLYYRLGSVERTGGTASYRGPSQIGARLGYRDENCITIAANRPPLGDSIVQRPRIFRVRIRP
jgi:hypothetical protein